MPKQIPSCLSAREIAAHIGATETAVRQFICKEKLQPRLYADISQKRPLYDIGVYTACKKGCPRRKKKTTRQPAKIIHVRIPATELPALEEKAKQAGLPLSTMIRDTALNKELTPNETAKKIYTADPKLLQQIARIGNNTNQIARVANEARANGKITPSFMQQMMAMIADIEDQMQSLAFEFE